MSSNKKIIASMATHSSSLASPAPTTKVTLVRLDERVTSVEGDIFPELLDMCWAS